MRASTGEIVPSGDLLVDEQREHYGHERKQTVDHGNDDVMALP
jgi:hypothetical protein